MAELECREIYSARPLLTILRLFYEEMKVTTVQRRREQFAQPCLVIMIPKVTWGV